MDVEPDEGEPAHDKREPWLGFERVLRMVGDLRPRLEAATGAPVHFTWVLRTDPQVAQVYGSAAWVAEAYGRELDDLVRHGDALGIHPHAWRWDERQRHWLQDHGDAAWVEEVMRSSAEAFEVALGRCEIHKFGSRFTSPVIVRVLRDLRMRYDLTVEPGALPRASLSGEATTGRLPDAADAPRSPYRPAPDDPLRPIEGMDIGSVAPADDVWFIPNTSFDPDPLLPTWRRIARRLRYPLRSRLRPIYLTSPLHPGRFWRVVEDRLEDLPSPFLSFSFRSDAPLRPYGRLLQEKLDTLLSDPIVHRLAFETPSEMMARPARW